MNSKSFFYFDLETCGKYKNLEEFCKADPRGSEMFEYKYSKKMKKVDGSWGDNPDTAYLHNSPLLCEYGQILCLSMAYFKKDGSLALSSISLATVKDERELINEAQKIFNKVDELGLTLCGYNIKGFDIPWLFRKMCIYGLKVPRCISTYNKKPWEVNVLDLMDVWKSTSFEPCTFDEVAYSLNIPSPKDGAVNGSKVHSYYWETGDVKAISEYCEKDVKTLVEICKKLENVL